MSTPAIFAVDGVILGLPPCIKQGCYLCAPSIDAPLRGQLLDPCHDSLHRFHLPDLRGQLIVGASDCWIIVKEMDYTISLINQWSDVNHQQSRHLPSLFELHHGNGHARRHPVIYTTVNKVTLSPLPLSIVVAQVCGLKNGLAIAVVDEEQWSHIDGVDGESIIDDVIYHKSCFYVLTPYGKIIVCPILLIHHVISYNTNLNLPTIFALSLDTSTRNYFVVIDRELYVVVREINFAVRSSNYTCNVDRYLCKTKGFMVFKENLYPFYNIVYNQMEEVKSIKEFSFFLGSCKYYTDDFLLSKGRGKDVVLNMDDGFIHTYSYLTMLAHQCINHKYQTKKILHS